MDVYEYAITTAPRCDRSQLMQLFLYTGDFAHVLGPAIMEGLGSR